MKLPGVVLPIAGATAMCGAAAFPTLSIPPHANASRSRTGGDVDAKN